MEIINCRIARSNESRNRKFTIYKSKFNFKKLVYECIETESYIHKNYNIECKTESDIEISGDRYRLRWVITNYLANAIKYSTSNRKIEVNYKLKDKQLSFSIRDYGLGRKC
ncbi:MAG: ATP-binding protein [Bacteroidia bacterium]